MPYLAPEAAMPITSCAPRLAERKAKPEIHAGMLRPDMKKSLELFIPRLSATPMPMTNEKYVMRISQSMVPSWILCVSGMGTLRVGHARWLEAGGGRQAH